jgi:5-methylcytosine-specific restriction endonuclease McrA
LQVKQDERREDHLMSAGYRVLRQKVMRHYDGVCQGCLDVPATQVHHLTYANFGNELAFQLIPLCDDCHDRVHAKAEAAE